MGNTEAAQATSRRAVSATFESEHLVLLGTSLRVEFYREHDSGFLGFQQ
jgi:hypothetical protein